MKIIMIGPQACGKGTQAKKISQDFKIPHISSGDLFREIRNEDSDLGKKVKELHDNGRLIDDETTVKVVENKIKQDDCEQGFILDGFPRNMYQAEALNKMSKIDHVLYIKISNEVAIQRLSGRVQCKKCGAIFGIANPSRTEGICDDCGGVLYQRADDVTDAIQKRLNSYYEKTQPLIDYYKEKGVLHEINGERGIDEIYADILTILRG
ncbi:adenylate kinase [Candidatus Aenigmatarchaeota archaeon]